MDPVKWAFGVGEDRWNKLGQWVQDGGTLVAIGSAVETARELLDLPIEAALPAPQSARPATGEPADRVLRDAFQSPASLWLALRERVIDPTTLFYCPGSLLENQFDTTHPVAFGMPERWPVFFESDQAYRLSSRFGADVSVVCDAPPTADPAERVAARGTVARGMASVVSIRVGRGPSSAGQPGGLPDAAAGDVQAVLQPSSTGRRRRHSRELARQAVR
jgi:hypothetical protein